MGAVGYVLGLTISGYFKGLFLKTLAEEKGRLAQERVSSELMSIAEIYVSAHDIDLVHDTFTEIICTKPLLAETIAGTREKGIVHAQQTLHEVMVKRTDPRSWAEMVSFIDFSTLDERLKYRKTIIQEFLNVERRWVRGRFIASKRAVDGSLTHVLWLVEDINIEKRGRDALIDMSQRAMAASEAKSTFLSNMSHEIRTPINAVLGMNEMILRECDDPNILGYAENVKTAGSTLLGLVNDILDFSKIESGKMEIIPVDYDLSSVLNDLVNIVQTRADAKGLALELDFDPGLPLRLKGDEVRVKQVVTNLLTNAVKYTEKGAVTFRVGFEKIPEPETKIPAPAFAASPTRTRSLPYASLPITGVWHWPVSGACLSRSSCFSAAGNCTKECQRNSRKPLSRWQTAFRRRSKTSVRSGRPIRRIAS